MLADNKTESEVKNDAAKSNQSKDAGDGSDNEDISDAGDRGDDGDSGDGDDIGDAGNISDTNTEIYDVSVKEEQGEYTSYKHRILRRAFVA